MEPTAAFRVVQTAGRESGEVLPVSESTLKRRLRDKGLLASTDAKRQTLTIRRTISGSSKDVLHFCRSTLLPEEPDETCDYNQQPDGAGHQRNVVGFRCREIPVSEDLPDNDLHSDINELNGNCRECRVSTAEEGAGGITAVESVNSTHLSTSPSRALPKFHGLE